MVVKVRSGLLDSRRTGPGSLQTHLADPGFLQVVRLDFAPLDFPDTVPDFVLPVPDSPEALVDPDFQPAVQQVFPQA